MFVSCLRYATIHIHTCQSNYEGSATFCGCNQKSSYLPNRMHLLFVLFFTACAKLLLFGCLSTVE